MEFEKLHQTAVYLDDRVDLSVPDDVQTVRAPNNADLVVLSGDPETDAEQSADWLAHGRVIALLGEQAERTWLAWVQSDVYTDTFDVRGVGDSEPDPELLVAAAIGLDITSYNRSWSDDPRDHDVLRALDEVLVDLDERTPQ